MLSLLLASLLSSAAGLATVPAPDRVEAAIADANVASARDQALRLEVSLQVGERAKVALGELVSHPTGLARLELRGAGDLIERHLLQGSELTASRNGDIIDDPRAFLPPFFILQADNGLTVHAALETFAVDADTIGLAECGDDDCLLIGDPRREIPRPEPAPVRGLEVYGEVEEVDDPGRHNDELRSLSEIGDLYEGEYAAGEEGVLEGKPIPGEGLIDPETGEQHFSRVWVDQKSYEIRGFDSARGVHIRFGPPASFDRLRVPSYILIEEPGKAPARLDVLRAVQVNAPASAFTHGWLFSPVDTEAPTPDGSELMSP